MAKALVISDVHSNIFALEAIWKEEKDSDIIYCAGDLTDPLLYASETIQWIRDKNAVCVIGGHDSSVATKSRAYHKEQENVGPPNQDDIDFLANLPVSVTFDMDSISYCMKHEYEGDHHTGAIVYGTINSEYHFDKFWRQHAEPSAQDCREKRIIFGHTHLRAVHYLTDNKLWMNPGSCHWRANKNRSTYGAYGEEKYRPYEPTKNAHYITITDGHISLRSLAYDGSELQGLLHKAYVE